MGNHLAWRLKASHHIWYFVGITHNSIIEAYNLGYTEPDPRDDLSGKDVARKALILARKCGAVNVEIDDILVEPLFHSSLKNLSVSDFIEVNLRFEMM